MKSLILSHATAIVLTVPLVFAATSGCSHAPLSAMFVNHDNKGEVDMLHLVESPPGHLTGSLVISSLNTDGSRKGDAVYDVSGTISGINVSLKPNGGLVGLAEIFGAATNLVGSLKGGVLTLSIGNQTEVFHKASQKKYSDTLANLDELGMHIATVKHATDALKNAESEGKQLNDDLKAYISWGQQRIDHVPNLRRWYAVRIEDYSRCLRRIRPLADSGIPAWRWQGCVLAIENDSYERGQAAQAVRDVEHQNSDSVSSLNTRISAAQQQFTNMLSKMKSACPYTNDIEDCEKELRKSLIPTNGFIDSNLLASYRAILPRVSAAVTTDNQTSAVGQEKLSAIAQQVDRIYRSAH